MSDSSLQISDLHLSIGRKQRWTPILQGLSFDVPEGRVTGLAGESGSGKSMTGLCILGLQPPGSRVSGEVTYDGKDLLTLPPRAMNALRGRELALISQDPSSSLHPMLRIGTQLTDHYRFHTGSSRKEARERALEMLERAQVTEPESTIDRYPHQFSGGQLQRIAIAAALMCDPKILIADEPTTALDVTVQAGILRLIRDLCDDMGLGVLLITHDLGVMSSLADEVIVLRDGLIVEQGHREQVITSPTSDYTRELVESLPGAVLEREHAQPTSGDADD